MREFTITLKGQDIKIRFPRASFLLAGWIVGLLLFNFLTLFGLFALSLIYAVIHGILWQTLLTWAIFQFLSEQMVRKVSKLLLVLCVASSTLSIVAHFLRSITILAEAFLGLATIASFSLAVYLVLVGARIPDE
ncbi:hypothetical protein [Sanyastnella coralliicola]|uniref:hypothetical protein n=1 Tax=Sanyastnella coralliicola TaxID=3069118 RepID=UPI0027B9AD62|nr:hypothetical protein [Longitalea sp. SCSIO 12813]